MTNRLMNFGSRLIENAAASPTRPALIGRSLLNGGRSLEWRTLLEDTRLVASQLKRRGCSESTVVAISLENSIEHLIVALAGWWLGSCVVPINPRQTAHEFKAFTRLLPDDHLIIGDSTLLKITDELVVLVAELFEAGPVLNAEPITPTPGKGICSGGTTGTPKLIIDPSRWELDAGELIGKFSSSVGFQEEQVQLVAGPMYHNAPFLWAHYGLFERHTLVVPGRFHPEHAVELVGEHGVSFVALAPIMMQRMLPHIEAQPEMLSTLRALLHTAAPCPDWVKAAWIRAIGPERIFEIYGSTEGIGHTTIRGDEWLLHRGSVGRALDTEIRILDDEDKAVPVGSVGHIFMGPIDPESPPYRYIGAADLRLTDQGFASVGDQGWVDQDGYLYLSGRDSDLIISGGVNVYPAEIEAVLGSHPKVHDVVVVGVPDDQWGEAVHAVVQLAGPLESRELLTFARSFLSAAKVPKAVTFVEELPRHATGKIRRTEVIQLVEARGI